MQSIFRLFLAVALCSGVARPAHTESTLSVLYLGDNGHHQPRVRFGELQPVLAGRGIDLVYTDSMSDLNADNLAKYAALVVYANIDRIESDQEQALLGYVAGGGGFVPLHCATYCFRNSNQIIALMGGQFKRHGTGVFRTELTEPNHPIMRGFGGFESWDETYVHHLHNEKNRTVLEYRVDADGREPWTWVRTHGKGRVFYTAWGHDQRTFNNKGFQNLVERGIRWAAGDKTAVPSYHEDRPFPVPQMTELTKNVAPFEYIDVGAKIPHYTKNAAWGTQSRPLNMMQKALAPAESIKHYSVPQGFHLELFVSEPDLGGKPICLAWDERGRLWVAETYDYPNELQAPGKGRDRIRICEDTNGDGKADKFTVFAEKLSIPTSIAFHRGGAIVQNGVETLYLRDTNGDDVADERTVLFSNWNEGDTHGGVSNFQYGLDNWIWAMQGYNNSKPRVKGEEQESFRMGFFRFRPDGSEIEFIRSTNNNTWGLGISEEGLIFGSTANHNPSVYMPIANRYYEQVRGWTPSLQLGSIADTYLFKPITDKVRQVDQFGGYTAGAGHALYTARSYPQEYWNKTAFVNGPTGHLVGTFVLKPDGSDFKSASPFNLVAADDEWAAPIMSEVGPDGNVWILDWYNYIIQHNPTPQGFKTGKGNAYETDLRDKKHGRVYRLVYDDAVAESAADPPMSLADATADRLVKTLSHPTMLWRKHAQRILVEQGRTDIVPALIELTLDESQDEIGLNVGAIHALWTLHGLGAIGDQSANATAAVYNTLKHPSAGVRRNAVQVLPSAHKSVTAIGHANLLNDSDAQVRLAAMLSLADLPASDVGGEMILQAMMTPANWGDRWIPEAATAAAAKNGPGFLSGLADLKQQPSKQMLDLTLIVAEHVARSSDPGAVARILAEFSTSLPAAANAVVRGVGLGTSSQTATRIDAATEAKLEQLLPKLEPANRGQLAKLATRWGSRKFKVYSQEIAESLRTVMDNEELSDDERIMAAVQMIEFDPRSKEVVARILDRISAQTPPKLATGLVSAIRNSQSPEAGKLLVDRMPSLTPSSKTAAIPVLLSRVDSSRALVTAIDKGSVPLADLSLDQKQALAVHPDREIRRIARRILERGGALPDADRQKVLDQLMAITQQKGDAAAGRLVFVKQCSKCHTHSGEGKRIGPDLTGMAVHPKHELLTHIIDPSRSVEGNFRIYTVAMVDGRVLNGMLASESKTAIEIIDTEGKSKSVLREDIEDLIGSTKSLMPEGFEKQVSRTEARDLLEFLTKRGRFLPVDISRVATLPSDRGMFVRTDADAERLIFKQWGSNPFRKIPFNVIDPQGGKVANTIVLYGGPNGSIPRKMPKSAEIICNGPARAIHLLGGVGGWASPFGKQNSVSMIVRLNYQDGQSEDHELLNGVHIADYIRHVDVPGSELAFKLRGQQIRYLAVYPKRKDPIKTIEFIKGPDGTAPLVMAVTVESP
jgi:putative membrane-bound dehydrogenase-like protein